jgi:hypothetical protein
MSRDRVDGELMCVLRSKWHHNRTKISLKQELAEGRHRVGMQQDRNG